MGMGHSVAQWDSRADADRRTGRRAASGGRPRGRGRDRRRFGLRYELSLAGGPICGRVNGRVLAAVNADGGATITPPTTNAQGGFGGYRPLPELPPRAGYLIALDAAG
jgi:hypothetical protein